MEVRLGGLVSGQKWRATGFRVGDTPEVPARVQIEFYVEFLMKNGLLGHERIMPTSLDPELARELGHHLITMAAHAEM
jgi:hypothetical protein